MSTYFGTARHSHGCSTCASDGTITSSTCFERFQLLTSRVNSTCRPASLWATTRPLYLQLATQILNQYNTSFSVGSSVDGLLFNNPLLLWFLAAVSYIPTANALSSSLKLGMPLSLVASWVLCAFSLIYKLLSTYQYNPELLNFAPPWVHEYVTAADHIFILRCLWTSLAATSVYLILQPRISGRVKDEREYHVTLPGKL